VSCRHTRQPRADNQRRRHQARRAAIRRAIRLAPTTTSRIRPVKTHPAGLTTHHRGGVFSFFFYLFRSYLSLKGGGETTSRSHPDLRRPPREKPAVGGGPRLPTGGVLFTPHQNQLQPRHRAHAPGREAVAPPGGGCFLSSFFSFFFLHSLLGAERRRGHPRPARAAHAPTAARDGGGRTRGVLFHY